jgi:hypothetical protein
MKVKMKKKNVLASFVEILVSTDGFRFPLPGNTYVSTISNPQAD